MAKFDISKLNIEAQQHFYKGCDIFFMHGWFSAYLSAPSDSEEDDVIPTYLVLDEDKMSDEKAFTKFLDSLMDLFGEIADNLYEKNKALKPILNLNGASNSDNLTIQEKRNLFVWLYGYLSGFVVIGSDITEYCKDEKLLDEVFFPALITICSALLLLAKEVNPKDIFAPNALEDYNDLCLDLDDMWENDEGGKTFLQTLEGQEYTLPFSALCDALTAIFFVVRTADEARMSQQAVNPLLKNLSIH
jgi:hypothetical protein